MRKQLLSLLIGALTALTQPILAQIAPPSTVGLPGRASRETELPTFNLDFPGGNPELLVKSINEELRKGAGAEVNVIIPTEFKNAEIPAMKLKHVNVQQVFEALSLASEKKTFYKMRDNTFREVVSSYRFHAQPPITPNSVWFFSAPRAYQPSDEKICRYYQLGPYLESGLDVNDITTAIKAGYKMLGDDNLPEMNFHKETKLLIVVVADSKARLVDEVLNQLPRGAPAPRKPNPPEAPAKAAN